MGVSNIFSDLTFIAFIELEGLCEENSLTVWFQKMFLFRFLNRKRHKVAFATFVSRYLTNIVEMKNYEVIVIHEYPLKPSCKWFTETFVDIDKINVNLKEPLLSLGT